MESIRVPKREKKKKRKTTKGGESYTYAISEGARQHWWRHRRKLEGKGRCDKRRKRKKKSERRNQKKKHTRNRSVR